MEVETLSHHEHVLLRPDSYVGSTVTVQEPRWVFKQGEIKLEDIEVIPALLTIFDEVLVNAIDNAKRLTPTTKIRIYWKEKSIRVENNGQHISIRRHENGEWIPTLVFSKLLTSTNYNDEEERVVGGLNGLGVKCTNIFSKRFQCEVFDPIEKKLFVQTFENNMFLIHPPKITKKSKHSFTTAVEFEPDFDDWKQALPIFKRRVIETAMMLPKVAVYLNGTRVKINSLKRYVTCYGFKPLVYSSSPHCELAIGMSEDDDFHHITFVNGIHTRLGGTHLTSVKKQVVHHIQTILKRKKTTTKLSHANIQNKLFLFVNATIINPHFSSQTKETCTTSFTPGVIPLAFVERAIKTNGLLQALQESLQHKEFQQMSKQLNGKKTRKIKGIPKLSDAQCAGTPKGHEASLIVTEGDSAASMALAGLSVVGRKKYGVFPLKGKLLNVQTASKKTLLGNKEIQHLMKILGLQMGKVYNDTSLLRYGSIIIMADQDVDGFHIGGLLLNFLHTFWPSLCRLPFVKRFITPLIKVRNLEFFDLLSYEQWASSATAHTAKYYKGLGTSTNKEAKSYFSSLEKYVKDIYFDEYSLGSLELVFHAKKSDERKSWMRGNVVPMDYTQRTFRVYDLIHSELLDYSKSSLVRAIPCIIDGLKESQRKILFGMLKRNAHEIKVAQLAAYVADKSMYTHGEASLCSAIVKMAQDFVGSNNLPLLAANGQFGSRQQNGKDAASPRYIFTELKPYTTLIFREEDKSLYTTRVEEGHPVEPEYYLPIIPMVLVNGANGIATGFRTSILPYKLPDILRNLNKKLRGGNFTPMVPFIQGYTGTLTSDYISTGIYSLKGRVLTITELPLGVSIVQYKTLLTSSEHVSRFDELHEDENSIHFRVYLTDIPEDLVKAFRLRVQHTKSFYLLDQHKQIKHYTSECEILDEYFTFRLHHYEARRLHFIQALEEEGFVLTDKIRYIEHVLGHGFDLPCPGISEPRQTTFLNQPIRSLTAEKIHQCHQLLEEIQRQRQGYQQTTAIQMYQKDLETFNSFLLKGGKKRKRK